jgi:hypothetical protein
MSGMNDSENVDEGLHESEINIFQQLCLDRHDDCAAIEILLEDHSAGVSNKTDIPDLNTASSGSTEQSSHAFSKETPPAFERKRTFLKRLFKSPRKNTSTDPTKFPTTPDNTAPESHSSEPSSDDLNLPKPPSTISKARSKADLKAPISMSTPVLLERCDTFSNMSSLSGTRATRLKTPIKFHRHESLGTDSIKDIRNSLKEMEKQLGQASTKGNRISRQKVMRALFTVADSLDDIEERDFLRKELEVLMRTERHETQPTARPLMVASSDDDKSDITLSDDDEDCTRGGVNVLRANEPPQDKGGKENAPFSLFSSVGKLFSMSSDDKKAVEQALDDLLWTEFVASRKPGEADDGRKVSADTSPSLSNSKKMKSARRSKTLESSSRRIGMGSSKPREKIQQQPFGPAPLARSRRSQAHPHRREHLSELSPSIEHNQLQRARSWWRRHPTSPRNDGAVYEEDDESVSSEEYPAYLPTSITVRKPHRNPETKATHKAFSSSSTSSRYQVKLVDTESRYGYEMASTAGSSIK